MLLHARRELFDQMTFKLNKINTTLEKKKLNKSLKAKTVVRNIEHDYFQLSYMNISSSLALEKDKY